MELVHKYDRKSIPGSVVFIFAPIGNGLVKITTSQDPNRLVGCMNAGSATKFELVGALALPTWNKAVAFEQRIRRQLKPKQDNRFWYRLTLIEAEKLVELIRADIATRVPIPQLTQEQKDAQEAEWHEAGKQAFYDNLPLNAWPRVLPKYSQAWYRAKEAWQNGWNEGSGFTSFGREATTKNND